ALICTVCNDLNSISFSVVNEGKILIPKPASTALFIACTLPTSIVSSICSNIPSCTKNDCNNCLIPDPVSLQTIVAPIMSFNSCSPLSFHGCSFDTTKLSLSLQKCCCLNCVCEKALSTSAISTLFSSNAFIILGVLLMVKLNFTSKCSS